MKLYQSRHAKERAQTKLHAALIIKLIDNIEYQECMKAVQLMLFIDDGEFANPDTHHIPEKEFTKQSFNNFYQNKIKSAYNDALNNAQAAIECINDAQTLLGLDEMKENHMLYLADAIAIARCGNTLKLLTDDNCKKLEMQVASVHKTFKKGYQIRKEQLCNPVSPQ